MSDRTLQCQQCEDYFFPRFSTERLQNIKRCEKEEQHTKNLCFKADQHVLYGNTVAEVEIMREQCKEVDPFPLFCRLL